jgi:hypothetical protein
LTRPSLVAPLPLLNPILVVRLVVRGIRLVADLVNRLDMNRCCKHNSDDDDASSDGSNQTKDGVMSDDGILQRPLGKTGFVNFIVAVDVTKRRK